MNHPKDIPNLAAAMLISKHERKPMKAARGFAIGKVVKTGHEMSDGGIVQVKLTPRDIRLLDIVSLGELDGTDYGLKPQMRVGVGAMTGIAMDDDHIVFYQRDVMCIEATAEEAKLAGAPAAKSRFE